MDTYSTAHSRSSRDGRRRTEDERRILPSSVLRLGKCVIQPLLTLAVVLLFSACAPAPSSRAAQPATAAPTTQPTSTATAVPTTTPPPTATPFVEPQLGSPAFALQNTPASNDLTQDGYSWSQANPIIIDKFDKIILPAQRNNAGNKSNAFVYSNNAGRTWQDNAAFPAEGYIERGAAAYDPENDVIHVLWVGQSAEDGIFYRRYTVSRDGAHNITGIEKTKDVNLILDHQTDGAMYYQHPVLISLSGAPFGQYGGLLAAWSARNGNAKGGNEIRSSLCVMGKDALACGAAAGWSAPVQASPTTIGNAAQVAYTALLANKAAAIPYASILRKSAGTNAGDVYLYYHDGDAPGTWAFRRMRWSATTHNWSAGLTEPTTISALLRAGKDTGYTLKSQLGSRPVEDIAGDRVYFGFASWKDNAAGDTWSFVATDAAHDDRLGPIVDVYSAGGAHSYAPDGDLTFDPVSARLVVAYITTKQQQIGIRLYDGDTPKSELAPFGDAPADIPLLAPQARYGSPARLLIVFRDTVRTPNPPYHGWAGTVTWN